MKTKWMDQGNCRNKPPEMFFPSDGLGVVIAKEICGTCKVKEQCLNHALQNHISHGVWGGTSERQRRRIRKEQRLAIKTS
jgi:WhiB family redox-sensing transcriptional regulator